MSIAVRLSANNSATFRIAAYLLFGVIVNIPQQKSEIIIADNKNVILNSGCFVPIRMPKEIVRNDFFWLL